MEFKKFVSLLENTTRKVLYYPLKSNLSINSFRLLELYKESTQFINYHCDFDSEGYCKRRRDEIEEWKPTVRITSKCCCVNCARCFGYLGYIPNSESEQKKIASLFDSKLGFQSDTGCKLPRKYRDKVCLSFYCYPNKIHSHSIELLNRIYHFKEDVQYDINKTLLSRKIYSDEELYDLRVYKKSTWKVSSKYPMPRKRKFNLNELIQNIKGESK